MKNINLAISGCMGRNGSAANKFLQKKIKTLN
jgi:hypothetical protein